jgi:hypothetical protein
VGLAVYLFRRGYKLGQKAKESGDMFLKPELMGSVPGKEKKKAKENAAEMGENNSQPRGPEELHGTPRSELP